MAASPPVPRGYAGAALDRFSNWYLGLSPGSYSYTAQPFTVPMPDGVSLAADLYQPILPASAKPSGLLLVQGCYGRGLGMSSVYARIFAVRGYAVLFVSTRGTFGSGGEFEPAQSEAVDSQAIVEWMRTQPWYPGSFATVGGSYLGYSQWALLDRPPHDLVAAAILVAPHDYYRHNWGAGSFRMDRIMWSNTVVHQEDKGSGIDTLMRIFQGGDSLDPVLNSLPIAEGLERHFGDKAPWLHKAVRLPGMDDPYWTPTRHEAALERADMPVMLVTGWYDPFTTQTLEQYARLLERKCKVVLTAGPWTHMQAAGLKCMPGVVDFLDEHVAQATRTPRGLSARIYVTGAEDWREMPSWPPQTTRRQLYLQSDKGLSVDEPPADAESSTFTYDPADPTPTMGGGQLTKGGRIDDGAYASRRDVLVFTSDPITAEVEVLGKPVVRLAHSSDIPFVDLWIRLSEVDTSGVSHNICEVFQGLNPERDASAPVELALQDCAHRFCKGTRMRLIVAGGSFPLYARNLGTEGSRTLTSDMRTAQHTIAHAGGSSMLILPVG